MPVSLKPGHVRSPRFHINKDWPFEFRIEGKGRIDHHRLVCLMGLDLPSDNCTEPAVIRANWVLTDEGKFVAQGGTSRDLDLGGEEGGNLERRLGGADLKTGHNYTLDIDFTQDGSVLAAANPHLVVAALSGGFYEDARIGLFLFYLLPCASVVLLGIGILVFSGMRRYRRRKLACASRVPHS
jgi:hypothetical protein